MTSLRSIGTCLVACCIAGAAHAQAPAPTTASVLPPVETFFKRATYDRVTLSPDGKLLAALVPVNERRNLALIDLDRGTATVITSLQKDDVESYAWIGNRLIEVRTANLADASGSVFITQDILLDTTGHVVRDLRTSTRRPPSRVIATLDVAGDDLVIVNNDRDERGIDAYRFNPRTNAKQMLTVQSPGNVSQFIADRDGQVRIAVSVPRGGLRTVLSYRRSNDDAWKVLRDDAFGEAEIQPLAFGFDNKTLYVHARNAAAGGRSDVYAFDPETNQLGQRVFESRGSDAGRLVFDWTRRIPVGVADGSRDGIAWIDADWSRLQASIDASMPRTRNRITWGRDDTSRVLVLTDSETQPPVYYLLDRTTHKMQEVAASYPWLDEKKLSPRAFVRYPARDGLSIPAFLTMPRSPDGAKPPLVVDIHGGPFVPATPFGYNAMAQFLASRGYAVLQPDYRGTQGYGDAFYKAGWRQYGLAMQDDVTDGVRWLIASGKVDADRVCLMGGSYGGYATLWGLEKEPQMFRCGVAYVALADLELKFDVSWSDYMRGEWGNNSTNYMTMTVGDPDRDREKMREVSPLYHADRIQAPLLLAYGAADRRVPLVHGNRMRSALDKYGKPYEWVVYDDEGHGFNKDSNRYDFYRRIDAFLAKNLAPRGSSTAAATAPGTAVQ